MNKLTYYAMLSAIARISTWNEVSMEMINNSVSSSWDDRINHLMKENKDILSRMRNQNYIQSMTEAFQHNSDLINALIFEKEERFTQNMLLISRGATYGNIIPFILMGSVILSMFISIPLTYVCLGTWIVVQIYAIVFCITKEGYNII